MFLVCLFFFLNLVYAYGFFKKNSVTLRWSNFQESDLVNGLWCTPAESEDSWRHRGSGHVSPVGQSIAPPHPDTSQHDLVSSLCSGVSFLQLIFGPHELLCKPAQTSHCTQRVMKKTVKEYLTSIQEINNLCVRSY